MLETYSAVLENDHLQWTNEAPVLQSQGQPVAVLVTIINQISAGDLAAKKRKTFAGDGADLGSQWIEWNY